MQFPRVIEALVSEAPVKALHKDILRRYIGRYRHAPEYRNKSALATAALKERITAGGNVPAAMSPDEFREKSRKDPDRFGAIIRERGKQTISLKFTGGRHCSKFSSGEPSAFDVQT